MGKVSRTKELSRQLFGSPWFPMLFISEATKNVSLHLLAGSPSVGVTAATIGLAADSVPLWLFCYDDVKWGLQKAAEAADEVADEVTDES
jgi:hypothetical protein